MKRNNRNIVAIDIAKDTLQIQTRQNSFSVTNNQRGFACLQQRITNALDNPLVVCESTGGYERPLLAFLHAKRIDVALVNPRLIRAFALSEGIRAKTDPIDAEMIMRFSESKNLRVLPVPDKRRQQLSEWLDRRNQLSDEVARERNRLQKAPQSIRASIEKMIRFIEKQITQIDRILTDLIEEDPQLKERYEIITAIKGVAKVTAWHVLAELPEITQLNRGQITALAGLAPYNRDSGKKNGKRYIQGGRAKVRKCLFMATTSAARFNPVIAPYIKQLKERGKPHKCAITAGMRKLLLHIQSELKKYELTLVS